MGGPGRKIRSLQKSRLGGIRSLRRRIAQRLRAARLSYTHGCLCCCQPLGQQRAVEGMGTTLSGRTPDKSLLQLSFGLKRLQDAWGDLGTWPWEELSASNTVPQFPFESWGTAAPRPATLCCAVGKCKGFVCPVLLQSCAAKPRLVSGSCVSWSSAEAELPKPLGLRCVFRAFPITSNARNSRTIFILSFLEKPETVFEPHNCH